MWLNGNKCEWERNLFITARHCRRFSDIISFFVFCECSSLLALTVQQQQIRLIGMAAKTNESFTKQSKTTTTNYCTVNHRVCTLKHFFVYFFHWMSKCVKWQYAEIIRIVRSHHINWLTQPQYGSSTCLYVLFIELVTTIHCHYI